MEAEGIGPPRSLPRVSGVVLAAGSSRRLGRPKQLLELSGEPLLRHTVRHAMGASLDEVIVVLGSRADEIGPAVGELGQRTILNPRFGEGQSTSLLMGISAISERAAGVLVLLGDQPLVSTVAIDRMASAYREGRSAIVQASFEGVPGNPVLFDRSLFGELVAVSGDEGARSLIRRHRDAIAVVEVGDVAEVIDVDTEDDYARLAELWDARRSSDRG